MNYVYYTLPKSVLYHKIIGKKDPTHAFSIILEWLEKNTKYKIEKEVSLNITVPVKYMSDQRFHILNTKIGEHKVSGEIRNYLLQNKTAEMWAYNCPYSKMEGLLDVVKSNNNLLKEFHYFISFSVDFILKDSFGNLLHKQDFNGKEKSNFFVYLSEISTISPSIYFPFDYGQNFVKFYDYLVKHIPFKMNKKYLRMFIENKKKW